MITFTTLFLLALCHFIGDFIFQTNTMAKNKSSSIKWLTIHVLNYIIPFALLYMFWLSVPFSMFLAIIVLNIVAHWITDYITSRIAAHFYQNDNRAMFFKTIGFDQFIHIITIVGIHVLFVV